MLFLMISMVFWCDSGARGVWVGVGLVGALVGPEGVLLWVSHRGWGKRGPFVPPHRGL